MGGRTLNVGSLAIFSLIISFAGAFISLLMSKSMAKWTTSTVIRQPSNAMESWLTVDRHRHAEKAGIGMPEVANLRGRAERLRHGRLQELGPGRRVDRPAAVDRAKEEVEAVLGHEIAHIANGDMVTMTLLQGVMNTFVVFVSR